MPSAADVPMPIGSRANKRLLGGNARPSAKPGYSGTKYRLLAAMFVSRLVPNRLTLADLGGFLLGRQFGRYRTRLDGQAIKQCLHHIDAGILQRNLAVNGLVEDGDQALVGEREFLGEGVIEGPHAAQNGVLQAA